MSQDEVITLMESSKSADEWNDNTRKVKADAGGDYPSFWYESIVLSGLVDRVANAFGESGDVSVVAAN